MAVAEGTTKRILLIEDNPADAFLFEELLSDEKTYEISWTKRLAEAEAALGSTSFSLCVLDLHLPDGSGIDLVEKLLLQDNVPPIVVLSGQSQHDLKVARDAVMAGAQDYLPKDQLDEATLLRVLSMAIERHRLTSMLAQRERELEEAQKLARVGDWQWNEGQTTATLSREIYRQIGQHPRIFEPNLRNILRCLAPASRKAFIEVIRRFRQNEQHDEVLLEILQWGGARRDIRLEIRAKNDSENLGLSYHGIAQDVTELVAAERVKNEFVSVVSHELRTPLTSILGSLKLIVGTRSEGLSTTEAGLIDIALANGERLLALINDLLDIEKIESGNLEMEFAEACMTEIVGQAIAQNEPYAEQFGVQLEFVPSAGSPVANVDAKRMAQLLANLISNAVKFSEQGGTVTTRLQEMDEGLRISVIDHGIGIPIEFQSKIFQKFAQADSSDQRRHQGTGLGLSIVKLIAQRHGGDCHFESEMGQGTAFHVDLPKTNNARSSAKQLETVGRNLTDAGRMTATADSESDFINAD